MSTSIRHAPRLHDSGALSDSLSSERSQCSPVMPATPRSAELVTYLVSVVSCPRVQSCRRSHHITSRRIAPHHLSRTDQSLVIQSRLGRHVSCSSHITPHQSSFTSHSIIPPIAQCIPLVQSCSAQSSRSVDSTIALVPCSSVDDQRLLVHHAGVVAPVSTRARARSCARRRRRRWLSRCTPRRSVRRPSHR